MKSKKQKWIENLKPGALVAISNNNSITIGVFLRFLDGGNRLHYYDITFTFFSLDTEEKQKEFFEERIKGIAKGNRWTSYLNANATGRVVPYPEELLDKGPLKLYNEYKKILNYEHQSN